LEVHSFSGSKIHAARLKQEIVENEAGNLGGTCYLAGTATLALQFLGNQ